LSRTDCTLWKGLNEELRCTTALPKRQEVRRKRRTIERGEPERLL
jgi:hypothetical protein